MRNPSADLLVPVRQGPARRQPPVRWVQSFTVWMALAATLAVVAGLVLGILATAEAGISRERWTQSVQAHGCLQLFGFIATFVVALLFEFLPRLNQRAALPAAVRVGIPALLFVSAILSAVAQVWFGTFAVLAVPGVLLFAAGAAAAAIVTWRIPGPTALRVDPQPLFFRAATLWLVIAALFAMRSALAAVDGVVPLEHSRLVTETFLRGFVMLTVIGVALRAFVGHLGLAPLSPRQQVTVLIAVNLSVAVGAGITWFGELALLARLADVTYGIALIAFVGWFRILDGRRFRKGQPGYARMIPVAFAALVIYCVLVIGVAAFADNDGPGLYEAGAIRHVLMLGFLLPLMVAMSHIVLARFGTGTLPWPRVLTTAFVVVVVAWPLRVVPVLNGPPSDLGRLLLVTSGLLVMAGLVLVAAVSARTAFLVAARHRPQIA